MNSMHVYRCYIILLSHDSWNRFFFSRNVCRRSLTINSDFERKIMHFRHLQSVGSLLKAWQREVRLLLGESLRQTKIIPAYVPTAFSFRHPTPTPQCNVALFSAILRLVSCKQTIGQTDRLADRGLTQIPIGLMSQSRPWRSRWSISPAGVGGRASRWH